MNNTVGIVILIAALCVFVVAIYMVGNCLVNPSPVSVEEGFAQNGRRHGQATRHVHKWGFDGWSGHTHPFDSQHVPQITGPQNAQWSVWQYHPQNTLVDYRYYRAPDCTKSSDIDQHRIDSMADGRIGRTNQSTTATNAPCDRPSLDYSWNDDREASTVINE